MEQGDISLVCLAGFHNRPGDVEGMELQEKATRPPAGPMVRPEEKDPSAAAEAACGEALWRQMAGPGGARKPEPTPAQKLSSPVRALKKGAPYDAFLL
jgi:hypothetical protein